MHVFSITQAAFARSPPQALGWRGRDALTACGEEAHLPQEEGGVHMVQGLLNIPEAAVARAREHSRGQTSQQRKQKPPASDSREARE